jgi:hypothetical protein
VQCRFVVVRKSVLVISNLPFRKVAIDKYLPSVSPLLEGNVLPQRVICQGCKHILYEGAGLKPPDEIIHMYEGKCPKCAKKLSLLPTDVEVKPAR